MDADTTDIMQSQVGLPPNENKTGSCAERKRSTAPCILGFILSASSGGFAEKSPTAVGGDCSGAHVQFPTSTRTGSDFVLYASPP